MARRPMISWRAGRRKIDALSRAIAGSPDVRGCGFNLADARVHALAPYADGTPRLSVARGGRDLWYILLMTLTAEEIERYKRHLVLREVGGQGQQKIKAARVLVVGAGGLGSPVLMYLAAAGVGTLGIIDDDRVSLDNLQRQIVHATAEVGSAKVASAKRSIASLNPHVAVEGYAARIGADNALQIISRYDIVADGSDNFATRYLVSDACYLARKPLVFAAVGPFDGYLTTLKPHVTRADGEPYPSYRCIFPAPPPPGTVANCAEVGVLGAAVGVIGALQATEVLKEIVGIGEGLAGRLLLYDALSARFTEITATWDPANPLSGRAPTISDLSLHAGADDAAECVAPRG